MNLLKQTIINAGYALSKVGTINTPGKFEGCHWSAIPFYNMTLEGFSDETLYDDEYPIDIFFIDDAWRKTYELSADTYAVTVQTSEQGFVFTGWLTEREYKTLVALFEDADDDEYESWEFAK